jgi:hypothetical protein
MNRHHQADRQRLSVVMNTDLAARLAAHLDRSDGQEDLCFLTWRPSTGATRTTAMRPGPAGGDHQAVRPSDGRGGLRTAGWLPRRSEHGEEAVVVTTIQHKEARVGGGLEVSGVLARHSCVHVILHRESDARGRADDVP